MVEHYVTSEPGRTVSGAVPKILVSLLIGGLALIHPTWTDGSVSQAVASAGGWWIPLHLLLVVCFALLVVSLWTSIRDRRGTFPTAARVLLAAFLICNSFYLVIDGVGIGVLAESDPSAADVLWGSPWLAGLANATGATWAGSLLCVAQTLGTPRGRAPLVGLALTWLAFVAGATPLAGTAALVSRVAAIGTGAWVVYADGPRQIPFALLVFAAVLRQHVGAEAALGMLFIFLGLVARRA
jgi:hypothetical protein